MAYQPTGSGIGTLLRLIKEQRSQSPIIPPASEVASPIRDVIQGPVKTPESPGTNRVVSVRPETSAAGMTEPIGPVTPVAPSAPISPVVTRPVFAPVSPQMSAIKTVEGPMSMKVSGAPNPTMSLATSIKPNMPSLAPTAIPQRSRSGVSVLEPGPNPTPTPAPAQPSSAAAYAKTYKQTGSTVPYPTSGPTPAPSYNPLRNEQSGPSLLSKIATTISQSPFSWLKKKTGR